MIKEFIEMKKKEIRVKTALYSAVDKFIVEKQDMLDLVMRIYETLKNTPTENLQQELISQIVNVIHKMRLIMKLLIRQKMNNNG